MSPSWGCLALFPEEDAIVKIAEVQNVPHSAEVGEWGQGLLSPSLWVINPVSTTVSAYDFLSTEPGVFPDQGARSEP